MCKLQYCIGNIEFRFKLITSLSRRLYNFQRAHIDYGELFKRDS